MDDAIVLQDTFYIIPSGKMLTATDGKLKLEPRTEKTKKIKTIDLFFTSLAVVHQSFAVGIILSGTLDDGTLGLQIIKAHGGITLVQDDTAAYDGMPHSAIKSGSADFILPPGKMVDKLIEINKPFGHNGHVEKQGVVSVEDAGLYRQILSLLRVKEGVDFASYKQNMIIRRIQRRMALSRFEHPAAY